MKYFLTLLKFVFRVFPRNSYCGLLGLALVGGLGQGSYAQTADAAGAEATIVAFFDAMRAGDTTALNQIIAPDCQMYSVRPDSVGPTLLKPGRVGAFKQSVGSYPAGALDERINNLQVQVDGALAHAWMDYTFYFEGTFSHCGVNSFTLIWQRDHWQVVHIVDTRRARCE